MKVGFVSLGCSKNLIDTEMAIGLFKRNNFEIVNDVEKAEIIIINTCGFIESAKQEAINTILEMAEYKEKGTCKYLVVMGCLVQRYKKELQKALPEVDLFIEINDYTNYWNKILELLDEKEKPDTINNLCYMDRVISTGNKTAYLKIAEGCSNRCTYCAIPYIRGPYVSRPMEEVLEEAKDYCQKVLHCIDTVIPELKGDKKDDTDEYLRMTVDAVNNTLEMYNATRSLVQEHSDIDEAEINAAVSTLGTALKSGVDDAKADALDGMKKFIQAYGEAAKNITAA